MKKALKITFITLLIALILAGGVYTGLYFGGVIPDNSVSADTIIDRTDEDIAEINLKIEEIESNVKALENNQGLSSDEITKIKSNMQEHIETLKTYQALLKALQDEVKAHKEQQSTTNTSVQSTLQTYLTRLEHLETVVDSITIPEPLTTSTHTLTSEEVSSVIETGAITCKRYGNVVTIYITHIKLNVEVEAYSAVTIANILEEYRPSIHVSDGYVSMLTGSHFVEVSEEGNIILSSWANKITTEDWHTICLTYVV